ncbi:hypothetical protein FUAX_06740 [Fulvitalea axinellae]|uniref:Aminopeptidase n=1 Tax=Fulvitalea axinellae TaxID=1182444 RepID=A0AAU9CSA4_9BACT|nr:hypothetical protein FUAX_06740 [Fulvitalea axinellae]
MKRNALVPIASLLLLLCAFASPKTDLTSARIHYLIDIKKEVASEYWAGFSQKPLFGPMLYYTKQGLFVVNANDRLKKRIALKPHGKQTPELRIASTSVLDTADFYMHVSYDDSDTSALEYRNHLAMFSDVTLTEKFIPDVKDTDEWTSMVVHEMFHQYQRNFEAFRKRQVACKQHFNRDTLMHFYKREAWFKESLKKENALLLDILNDKQKAEAKTRISEYLKLKKARIEKIKARFGIDIAELEDNLSRSEGTARYIEYCTKLTLKNKPEHPVLSKLDGKYKANRFKNYSLRQDSWMYGVQSTYFYSVGFNLTRILEKLDIPYQQDMFLHNRTFDSYLEEFAGNGNS